LYYVNFSSYLTLKVGIHLRLLKSILKEVIVDRCIWI